MAQVGAIAYRLDPLEEYRIHPIVHVSQLKRHMLATTLVEDDRIQIPDAPTAVACPIIFSASRMLQKGASSLFQIQVEWNGLPTFQSTWEEIDDLW